MLALGVIIETLTLGVKSTRLSVRASLTRYFESTPFFAKAVLSFRPMARPTGGGTAFPICRCFSSIVPLNLNES